MPSRIPTLAQNIRARVTNSRNTATTFVLEPWGETYEMPSEAVFDVRATGPAGDTLELAIEDDAVVVWAWPGSVVRIFHGTVELGSGKSRPPVPGGDIPAGPKP